MINAAPTPTTPVPGAPGGYQPPSAVQPGVAAMSTVNPGMPPAAAAVAPVAPVAGGPTGPVAPTSGAPTSFNAQPKPKLPMQYIVGALVLLLVVIGGGSAYFLSQSNQDVRNQAAGGNDPYTGSCTSSAQCASGYACTNGKCTANCTAGSGRPNGCSCSSNGQCSSGRCGRDPGDNTQACVPNTGTPTPTPGGNASCAGGGQLTSGSITCFYRN